MLADSHLYTESLQPENPKFRAPAETEHLSAVNPIQLRVRNTQGFVHR